MKKYFLPRTEADKLTWLKNFANKLGTYATKYGITAAEVTDMQNSAAFYDYWYNYNTQYAEYNKKLTQYKTELRDGIPAGATASVAPVPPTCAAAPTSVAPGIFVRATSLAGIIKKRSTYTEADGQDLGIEGTEDNSSAARIEAETKPTISVRLIQGGKPEIVWTKGDFDGIDIYVDRGNNQFVFLATDTYPNYTDNAPLPTTGAAVWRYKAIYRYGDEITGQYSDIASIAVGG